MGNSFYRKELRQLSQSYKTGKSVDVAGLKSAISGASESSVIAVGSGGSFTVASLLCNLHEAFTGRVSRPSTPLELICNPTLASASPVFLVSSEGKNPDVLEVLDRVRRLSARPLSVLTNRLDCPLMDEVQKYPDIRSFVYELKDKDGYLATNSLILDAVVVARAYEELSDAPDQNKLPTELEDLRVDQESIDQWIDHARPFAEECVTRGAMILVYSPLLKPIAADLESKLSESALLHVQLADLRSFAHGRHLWLGKRSKDCTVLALTEPSLGSLWSDMHDLFPEDVSFQTMELSGSTPRDLIAGLVASMHLVAEISDIDGSDPARPAVQDFGRKLYYLDLPDAIPTPIEQLDGIEQSKGDVLGSRWPFVSNRDSMRRAKLDYIAGLQSKHFRCIVFDYDGTLSASNDKDEPPPGKILAHLKRLVESGILVGIASGRGGSIQECLEKSLPESILQQLHLGLYNGGWLGTASEHPIPPDTTSEFVSQVTRIIVRLKSLGVPILSYKATHPYQVSVRFNRGLPIDNMWFVIADALRQAGLHLSSIVKSKYSVDVLAPGVSKSRLIAEIIQRFHLDPYDVLTVGDQGAWPGNDWALLEHRYSLSVDTPSRRLDRGWKLAPSSTRDVEATQWYLDRLELTENGTFAINVSIANN